jgi:hypothetical protein
LTARDANLATVLEPVRFYGLPSARSMDAGLQSSPHTLSAHASHSPPGLPRTSQPSSLLDFLPVFFSSAPVTNTGGVLGDLFSPAERATALAVYSMAVAGGPLLSPVVAGALITTGVSWRWTEYVRNLNANTSKTLLADFLGDDWDHDDGHSRGRLPRY